jgi:hypothetical protein
MGLGDTERVTVVCAALTVCTLAADAEPAKPASPEYVATTECVPDVGYESVQVALPSIALTVWLVQPVMGVPPSAKLMVPASGTGFTVALYVTD